MYHTRYIMKVVSADSYEYTDESGESENSMKAVSYTHLDVYKRQHMGCANH